MTQEEFLRSGLNDKQVVESRTRHGDNLLTPPKRTPWWKLLLEKFDDPIIRILLVAAAIAVIVGFFQGNFVEGIGIILAVLIATLMAFFNEYRAGLEFDILNKVSDQQPVKVVRDGGVTTVPVSQVVVGDHVIVDTGDEIPADGKIVSCISLGMNESSLTGELLVYKSAQPDQVEEKHTYPANMLYRGTTVMEGSAYFVVTAVGNYTEIGKTARDASMEIHQQTPLSAQLDRLSKLIGVIGFAAAFIAFWSLMLFDVFTDQLILSPVNWFSLFAVLIPLGLLLTRIWLPILFDFFGFLGKSIPTPKVLSERIWIAMPKLLLRSIALFAVFYGIGLLLGINLFSQEAWFSLSTLEEILLFVLVAITLIVVVVPEGLAMSVTLSLAYSMRKMTATNNLVRRMHATETMGATTVICTDKTGTLTQNQMRVVDASFFVDHWENDTHLKKMVSLSMGVNSKAFIDNRQNNPKPLGNPTDAALLLWLLETGEDYTNYRTHFNVSAQIPFSSENKYMATAGNTAILDKAIVLVKGAPEIIRSRCTHFYGDDGVTPIHLLQPEKFEHEVGKLQEAAKRTIAFAYKLVDESPNTIDDCLLDNLILLGFMGIADPIRPDVAQAVNECRAAGVDIKVVTGDIRGTAREICKQIGLCVGNDEEHAFVSGEEFSRLRDDDAKAIIADLRIMYRARPADKLKLVRLLQEMGEVVAVTGDGTNDAPALNRANVGLAMGSGSSVAKEASDIILLDDSFTSIVNAIRWGRSLYQNIQRFLVFQLTINLLALAIVLFGPLVGVALPLTVVQMLWINLIMDTFAALALATEPPNQEVMKHKPRSATDFIISPSMRIRIGMGALVFFIVLMGLLKFLQAEQGISPYELTLFFNVFVMLQFWNLFNVKAMGSGRSIFTGLKQSRSFLMVAAIILVGQVVIVQFGGTFFRTAPLSFSHWILIFFSTSLVLWVGEIFRLGGSFKRIVPK